MTYQPFAQADSPAVLRRRAGSVLILVIAILVILGLLGMSFLASARTDRYSSQQNIANTQIDLLVDGVVNTTESVVTDDLFAYDPSGNKLYRPAGQYAAAFDHYDSPFIDTWMASRVPVLHPVTAEPSWSLVSGPIAASEFESPDDGATWTERANLRPATLTLSYSTGAKTYPALMTDSNETYLAGDADGDGIADSGLWRIPVSAIDGVTYYAAVRVVDNSAAVNVNTAWSRTEDYDSSGTAITPNGYFPSSIGLMELLSTPSEMSSVTSHRFNGTSPTGIFGSSSSYPIADAGTNRTDFRYLSWGDAISMQLARRIANPGYAADGVKLRAFPISDSLSLAYRFCLLNLNASTSTLEQKLPASIYASAPNYGGSFTAYSPDAAETWFDDNFDFDTTGRPVRALLVTHNAVSNQIRPIYAPSQITIDGATVSTDYNGNGHQDDPLRSTVINDNNPVGMPSYSDTPARAAPNTASFGELWRAYWSVMAGSPTDLPPFGSTQPATFTYDPYVSPYSGSRALATHPQRMFRNIIRDTATPFTGNPSNLGTGTPRMDPSQMLLLRSGLAAVNTLDLRDGDNDITSQTIAVTVNGDYKGNKGIYITLYGSEAQPYLTEIYANTNVATVSGKQNKKGYFAIELHNPYSFPISMRNWRLVGKGPTLASIHDFGDTGYPTNPASGYLVIENYRTSPSGNDATYRPGSANAQAASATCAYAYVPALENIANKEVIIMRPRRADGVLSSANDGRNYNETQLYDLVPVDQFDFTGLPAPTAGSARLYHYVRPSGTGNAWKFVYPGRYDGGKSPAQQRHDGTQQSTFTPPAAEPSLTTGARIGGADASASFSPTFTIQIASNATSASSNSVGPNPVTVGAAGPFLYPFGGFARNGDLLQVPYIGAYRIAVRQDNGNDKIKSVLEINSITMDASFADDSDTTNDAYENLGRFCPTLLATDYYAWAADLFDYFNVLNPADDYLPNVSSAAYSWPTASAWQKKYNYVTGDKATYGSVTYVCVVNHQSPNTNTPTAAYFSSNWSVFPATPTVPEPVANSNSSVANGGLEDAVPMHGLININTASWRVLAALPMVANSDQNSLLAKSIVYHRDVDASAAPGYQPYGAFTNIFQLNNVSVTDASGTYLFRDAWKRLSGDHDAGPADGDFSPATGVDGVRNDFEEQHLMIDRISNLITTRSDSFTCYILVQGWRNTGTGLPELVVQRRVALIADRSAVTSTNKSGLSVVNVPTN